MCAVFLGVIEGVGIGFQRMMADNTKLEVSFAQLLLCVQESLRTSLLTGDNVAPSSTSG